MLCNQENLKLEDATYNEIRKQGCNVIVVMRDHGADSESNRHHFAYKKANLESKWVGLFCNLILLLHISARS